LAALAIAGAISFAAPYTCAREDPPLVKLAALNFPRLTLAERALLEFAERSNLHRAAFAIAGSSDVPLDPSNDPAHADEWAHERDIRAELIRWLAVDNVASTLVDPVGVRVLGARIVGPIILAQLHVPFVLVLVRCSIPDEMNLESADLPYLTLSGSHTSRINALNLVVHSDLNMTALADPLGNPVAPFESDMVNLQNAKIRGEATFAGAHFHYSEGRSAAMEKSLRIVLFLTNAEIGGDLNLNWGFESRGCTFIAESTIGADLNCWGARFINPGNSALKASGDDIKRFVFLGPGNADFAAESQAFESDGIVGFEDAHVGADFLVEHAVFGGKANELHGFLAPNLSVSSSLIWHDVTLANGAFVKLSSASVSSALIWRDVALTNGAVVDLSDAKVVNLFDEEKSWPHPGQLLIDGFTYDHFMGTSSFFPGWQSPVDARSRLRWLALQPGYRPDTYRQLAKVLRDRGDEAGAKRVRIAGEDLRYSRYGLPGRVWGTFLRYTIGYGHRPMLTIMWSALVVLLGWGLVRIGSGAGVMRRTYPENTPSPAADRYEDLYPLLYSLDVFLPFVNLHQEHYWWPDGRATGEVTMLGGRIPVRGSLLRSYLWLQIIAGWILSAIFVAGVTGLIRGD
jgi:hypothetical protein